MHCTRNPGCHARENTGHYCPASPEQVRRLGYQHDPCGPVSPFVRRALARELPAKVVAR